MRPITGVLIDLGGVVQSGGVLIPGAAGALTALETAGVQRRFLTNTTSQPVRAVAKTLQTLGLAVEARDILTPAIAAGGYLRRMRLAPHFLVSNALREDLPGPWPAGRPAVVVGDARDRLSYETLNTAFRLLVEEHAALIALAGNRRFVDTDGRLSLDVGAIAAALAFASETQAVTIGKPAPPFFEQGAAALGLPPENVAMIGDDPECDVAAALQAGLGAAYLVETGKWRPPPGADPGVDPGVTAPCAPPPTAITPDLAAAVAAILAD